jgi:hypothetical protein
MDTALDGPELVYSTANPYTGGQAFEANSGNGPSYGPDDAPLAYLDHVFAVTGNSTSSIPEPSTWAMTLLGFAGLGFAGYRSRKAAPLAV